MTILFHCPNGHDAEFTKSEESYPSGLTRTTVLCGKCGKTFIQDTHIVRFTGGPDYIPIGSTTFNEARSEDGRWGGQALEFVSVSAAEARDDGG